MVGVSQRPQGLIQFNSIQILLLSELSSGLVKAETIPLAESDNRHIHLYIRFRITAEQVGTPTLTNIWLVLQLLGALSSSLILSL